MIRIITGTVLLLTLVVSVQAQPINDDCEAAVNLGVLPLCTDENEFSNVLATASTTSSSGMEAPPCFNGNQVDRDVWFTFQMPNDISDVTIIIEGAMNDSESILQPQVALYRGICAVDQLNFLNCASSQLGDRRVRLDAFNLVGGQTYYLRVNDYSESARANSGDFQVCVLEYVGVFNIGGSDDFSSACTGTLFDSGGPDSNYDNSENHNFTICPNVATNCIVLDLHKISLEPSLDQLNIYEGNGTGGQLLATASTLLLRDEFRVASNSDCVTVEFISDNSVVNEGFELSWACQAERCEDSAPDNPDLIGQLPFDAEGINVCEDFSSVGIDVCQELGRPLFLGGPDYFFRYDAPVDQCVDIHLESTLENTGVAIFLLDDTGEIRECIDAAAHGIMYSVPLEEGESYLIAVANASGCFQFDLSIEPSLNCILNPTLDNSLCNPINTCFDESSDDLTTRLFFEESIVDFTILQNINSGCWAQDIDSTNLDSSQLDMVNFYWFTLEVFEEGNIGFFVNSFAPTDIDFNVWGPFSDEIICNHPDSVKSMMATTQPIRSSWARGDGPTGLADVHPVTGVPVFDEFDCDYPQTGPEGDGFVRTIPAMAGEHYVFLLNDFSGAIDDRGLLIDWSPMDLESILADGFGGLSFIDTTICETDTFFFDFLMPDVPLNIEPDVGVSCQSCDNPYILPSDSTIQYKITLQGQCAVDTLMLTLNVLEEELPDLFEICNGQELRLSVDIANQDATYSWSGDVDSLSCTQCPNPVFQSSVAGTYRFNYVVELSDCRIEDSTVIIVDEAIGPDYEIIGDTSVCEATLLQLGGMDFSENDYVWLLNDSVVSTESNPTVEINASATFVLQVSNGECPYPLIDSVIVEMVRPPVINVIDDVTVCEGDTLILNQSTIQEDVIYNWSSSTGTSVLNPEDGRGVLVPAESGRYTLRAVRGPCSVSDEVFVEVIPSSIEILPDQDTLLTCLGDSVSLSYGFRPATAEPFWVNGRTRDTLIDTELQFIARNSQMLYAYSESNGCPVVDSIYIRVDSLPRDLSISPMDTSICEGATVVLTSPEFDPALYEMVYLWTPTTGEQSGDTLYNFVITPDVTTTYSRISRTGVCVDTAMATVTVRNIPTVRITPMDTTICPGESVQIIAEVDPLDAMLTWSGGDRLSCLDCPNPVASPESTTTYSLEAEIEECPSEMVSITINVGEDSPPFDRPSDLIICEGERLELNPNEVEDFDYEWRSDDPDFNQQNERNPTVQPSVGSTTYFVTVTDPSSKCSENTDRFTVLVPVLDDLPDFVYCSPLDRLQATASFINAGRIPNNANVDYRWSTGDRTDSITFTPSILNEQELFLEANVDGCVTQSSGMVEQVDFSATLVGSIPDSSTVLLGSFVDLRLDLNIDSRDELGNIEWFENGRLIASGVERLSGLELSQSDRIQYIVIVNTASGCSERLNITYFPIPVQLPNAFSPNNDGQNDLFNIVGLEDITEQVVIEEFKVFSRWGTLIYDNENPQEGWDGTDGANDLPMDTYKYIISLRLGESMLTRQGEINLIR